MQSTLLRTIGGLSEADAGTVHVVSFFNCTAFHGLGTSAIQFNPVNTPHNALEPVPYGCVNEREVCCAL